MRIVEHRSLIKVKVIPQNNFYTLFWDKNHYLFQGSKEDFAKFLCRLKAKDHYLPASSRKLTYSQIVDHLCNNLKDNHVFIWDSFLKGLK